MAIKNTQIEDKSISPEKNQELIEFNYPEYNVTIRASSKEEADNKLKELINKTGRSIDCLQVQFSRMKIKPTRMMKKVLRSMKRQDNAIEMGNKKRHYALTMTEIETIWKEHRNGNLS